jgi:hypothetical protein
VNILRKPDRYVGLSTETKPTISNPGSTFFEYDTGNLHAFIGGVWTLKTPAQFPFTTTTIDLNQAAASYTLFTVGASDVRVLGLTVVIPADLTGAAAGALTSISVQSTDTTPVVLISSTAGAKANLTANKHLQYFGGEIVAATKLIQLTIAGGATGAEQLAYVFMQYAGVE